MKNTERPGVDIRVALASGARPGAQAASRGGASAGERAAHSELRGLKARLKQAARRCARAGFALVGPVARPLAFRLRAYFAAPLLGELQQLKQNLAQERSANRRWRESTERLLTTQTAQLLQEIRAAREPLRPKLSSSPSPVRAEADRGTRLLLGRLLCLENTLVARIDARSSTMDALQRATLLVSQQFEVVLLVAWAGPSSSEEAAFACAEWLRFFERSDLAFRAVHPETGTLGPARLEQASGSQPIELLVARAGSHAWQLAEGTQ